MWYTPLVDYCSLLISGRPKWTKFSWHYYFKHLKGPDYVIFWKFFKNFKNGDPHYKMPKHVCRGFLRLWTDFFETLHAGSLGPLVNNRDVKFPNLRKKKCGFLGENAFRVFKLLWLSWNSKVKTILGIRSLIWLFKIILMEIKGTFQMKCNPKSMKKSKIPNFGPIGLKFET